MTQDEFWNLISDVRSKAGDRMEQKEKVLTQRLSALTPEEIHSFAIHFDGCRRRAYTWGLWAAAYVIGGGCSDDGFLDFRSALISYGEKIFEGAILEPDSLVCLEGDLEGELGYEGFQYPMGTVYKKLAHQDLPSTGQSPSEPTGISWEEEDLAQIVPKLCARFHNG